MTRICENPGINHIQLSNLLKVDKTTTTKAVQKLIAREYLKKEKDQTDSRAYQLYPTPKSLEIYDLVIDQENNDIEVCFNGFTAAEKKEAYELIKRMSKNLELIRQDIKNLRSESV